MKSKTKFNIADKTVSKIFDAANLGGVIKIMPLSHGEFNYVLKVTTNIQDFVLKVAPKSDTPILTLEKNMLAQEIAFYNLIHSNTSMGVPKVFYSDFSKVLIDADYFIMEFMQGEMLNKVRLNDEQKRNVNIRLMEFLSELHQIKGQGFGYVQNGLKDNWYDAIKFMIGNLIADYSAIDKQLPFAITLLEYVEKYSDALKAVSPSLVNFDLWDLNILYTKTRNGDNDFTLSLIDPERCFYGDYLGDFVAIEFLKPLDKKLYLFSAYNKNLINGLSNEEKARYFIMNGYLTLIMQTEKPYRYKKSQLKYFIHTLTAKLFESYALKGLKSLDIKMA